MLRTRAFTLIELLVVIVIIAILIAILIPSLAGARNFARKAKDSTHVRAIAQGFGTWATNNDGRVPRPSALDSANHTVGVSGGEAPIVKDNTGNILSLLIYNGIVEAEQAVSPQETNDAIQVDTKYERDSAAKAEDPTLALWDPGFAGFPGESNGMSGVSSNGRRSETVGNTSYATTMPMGDRLGVWTADLSGNTLLAGTRGPRYLGSPGDWQLRPNAQGTGSNTLGLFGPDDAWSGHLGFGDGRVDFFREPDPANLPLTFGDSGPEGSFGDNVFVNENDNTGAASPEDEDRPGRWQNAYLRIYGDISAPLGDDSDPEVSLFFD